MFSMIESRNFRGLVELLLGAPLLGDIDMSGDPTALGHRPVADGVDVAVAQHVLDVIWNALGDLAKPGLDVLLGVLRRHPGADPSFENRAQRSAGFDLFGTKAVHFAVALVADDQPLLGIEHAQSVRHVLERGTAAEDSTARSIAWNARSSAAVAQDMRLLARRRKS